MTELESPVTEFPALDAKFLAQANPDRLEVASTSTREPATPTLLPVAEVDAATPS